METISHTMTSLSTIFGEEERCIAANLNGRAAQLALEDCRLLRERERVAVEESYIADEERALAEQTAEVEELIATQGGDNNIRRAELEAKQGELSNMSAVVISPYYLPFLFSSCISFHYSCLLFLISPPNSPLLYDFYWITHHVIS